MPFPPYVMYVQELKVIVKHDGHKPRHGRYGGKAMKSE
jgi:hypothetical protein